MLTINSLAFHVLFPIARICCYKHPNSCRLWTPASLRCLGASEGAQFLGAWESTSVVSEEPPGREQCWSVNCREPVGNTALAGGADIAPQAVFDLKYKGGESMCHIFPEPSASPLLMGRSGRFSNSHSFTGTVSLSTWKSSKTDFIKPVETTISELLSFSAEVCFGLFFL